MELPLSINIRRVPRYVPFVVLFELLLGLAAIIFPAFIPFLIIIAIAGFLLFLIKPELCYYLSILALAFDGVSLTALKVGHVPGPRTINAHHIFILMGFLALLVKIVRDRLEVQKTGLEGPLFVFFGWALISTVWSPEPGASFTILLQLFVALVFLNCMVQFFREENLLRRIVM